MRSNAALSSSSSTAQHPHQHQQRSETSAKLDLLNAAYQQHVNEKTSIQNQIERIRRDINAKEQEILSVQQNWIRERSCCDNADGEENNDDDDDKNNNAKHQRTPVSTPPPKAIVKKINEDIEQLQAEMKTLIQKSKFVGKKIDDLELQMLDVVSRSDANKKII